MAGEPNLEPQCAVFAAAAASGSPLPEAAQKALLPTDREVTVDEVHWPAQENEELKGKKITVLNLDSIEARDGWEGPGQYILPLRKTGTDAFVVVPPPMSPGFEPMKPRPRIYRATPETLRQLDAISKSK